MQVLLVLEDLGEAKALNDAASELGMSCRAIASLSEAEGVLKQQPWGAIVVRRGRAAIALKAFLRAATTHAPSAKIFVIGDGPQNPDDSSYRLIVTNPAIKLLGEVPLSEVVVRLFGARVGREPESVGFEARRTLYDRRTWSASLARERATGSLGVLAKIEPRIATDSTALEELGRSLPSVVAIKHPCLSSAQKVVVEAPSPLVFWSAPQGVPLSELIASSRGEPTPRLLPINGALGVMAQIAAALGALHEANVTHGAVEPWAVWLSPEGGVTLMHQGFAAFAEGERRRSTGRRFQLATPDDGVPPEKLVDDRNETPAGDIYGAGLVLYELLCGVRPFRRRSANETLQAILREPPASPDTLRPDVPAPLAALTLSMLAKSPEDRPKNGAALAEALLPMMPKADGIRGIFGIQAKPEALVASMMRERAKDLRGIEG